MSATTLLSYNFKGGVGKTTLTGMEGYLLSKSGKKVLMIDFDPQANLTQMIQATYNFKMKPKESFVDYLIKNNPKIQPPIQHASDNLDLIPADWDLNDWATRIARYGKLERWTILPRLLRPLKEKYDYIMIDVPPTLNDIVRNAIFAADGVSLVIQTQTMAYKSALKTIAQLGSMRHDYGANFTFLGAILYLYNKNARIDKRIIRESEQSFKGALFNEKIKYQERIKGFTSDGISADDFWDIRAIGNYQSITNELESKAKRMINNE